MPLNDKKIAEKKILVSVFSQDKFRIIESERPDFRLFTPGGQEFGVELTEFFANELIARLGKKQRDRDAARAAANYDPAAELDQADYQALSDYPSNEEQITALDALIAKKNKIVRRYEYSQPVILLIQDSNNFIGSASTAIIDSILTHLSALPALTKTTFADVILTWRINGYAFAYSLRSRSAFNPDTDQLFA